MDGWDGNPVKFNDYVSYKCKSGYFFEEDRDKVDHKIACKDDGTFDVPKNASNVEVWPNCVDSESLNLLFLT